ncbi:unnamed protein product, partial [Urochloa humidicola]
SNRTEEKKREERAAARRRHSRSRGSRLRGPQVAEAAQQLCQAVTTLAGWGLRVAAALGREFWRRRAQRWDRRTGEVDPSRFGGGGVSCVAAAVSCELRRRGRSSGTSVVSAGGGVDLFFLVAMELRFNGGNCLWLQATTIEGISSYKKLC